MDKETTHIRVKIFTKSKLDKLGAKNDTYDDIILRLIEGGAKK